MRKSAYTSCNEVYSMTLVTENEELVLANLCSIKWNIMLALKVLFIYITT